MGRVRNRHDQAPPIDATPATGDTLDGVNLRAIPTAEHGREARAVPRGLRVEWPRQPGERVAVDISLLTIFKILGVLLGLYILSQIWQLLILILVSAMLAAALAPYQEGLEKRGLPRALALTVVAVSVVASVVAVIALVVPALVVQTQALLGHSDHVIRTLQSLLADVGIRLELVRIWHALPAQLGNFNRAILDAFRTILDSSIALMTVVIVTLYMLSDKERLTEFFVGLFPEKRRPGVQTVLSELRKQVGGYVRGQLITSLLAAVYACIVLTVLGVPNAVALGVFVGVADLIPLFGQTIGTIPAVLIALTISPLRAIIVLGALVLYQQVENHYIVPRVYSNTMNVSAMVALIGLLIGAKLLGMMGMLIALPILASLPVILDVVGVHMPRAERR